MTHQSLSARLWFADGACYDRIEARVMPDGRLELHRHKMGAGDFAGWGEDDEETTLELEAHDVAKLALALLQERYSGLPDALGALQAFCETHELPAVLRQWT